MESAVKAALHVFGLSDLPKTQAELKSIYRRHVKNTHPDEFGSESTDTKPIQRVYRANEVIAAAMADADKPCVLVKFGACTPHSANVAHNTLKGFEPARECAFVVALKWLTGITVKVADGDWHTVAVPESFALEGVWIHFV